MVKGALLAGATPVAIALIRMLAAGMLLLPFEIRTCMRRHISFALHLSQLVWVGLAALLLALHYLTWITSLTGTSTFASVSLVCTQPLFVALFSYLLFHEVIPQKAILGALLSLFGAVLIAISGLLGDLPPETSSPTGTLFSSLLALLGAILMAAHWLVGRHIRQSVSAEVYTPILYLFTALILLACVPFMGAFAMPIAALPYMAALILGSTLLGHALFSFALSKISATVISFALLGEPVGAMLFAMLFLGEQPTGWVLLGGACTLLGLFLYLAHASNTGKKRTHD